ncbi:MAG: hypothetical protein KJI71_04430 [Patescibacteria group bacterium]|nr:hypothetical protein [Patescibacteria group bacterium]
MEQIIKKKVLIWLLLSINLLFAFIIGYSIPLLTSESSYNLGFVMIPLLLILNYVIIDRFHYHFKHLKDREEKLDAEV